MNVFSYYRSSFIIHRLKSEKPITTDKPKAALHGLVILARGVPPVPIPNTTVKTLCADGTKSQGLGEYVVARPCKAVFYLKSSFTLNRNYDLMARMPERDEIIRGLKKLVPWEPHGTFGIISKSVPGGAEAAVKIRNDLAAATDLRGLRCTIDPKSPDRLIFSGREELHKLAFAGMTDFPGSQEILRTAPSYYFVSPGAVKDL